MAAVTSCENALYLGKPKGGAPQVLFTDIYGVFFSDIFSTSLHTTGGAVASWLVCSTLDRVVRVRVLAGGHCVVFLGKTIYSHGASLHPGV